MWYLHPRYSITLFVFVLICYQNKTSRPVKTPVMSKLVKLVCIATYFIIPTNCLLFLPKCFQVFTSLLLHQMLQPLELVDVQGLKADQFVHCDEGYLFRCIHTCKSVDKRIYELVENQRDRERERRDKGEGCLFYINQVGFLLICSGSLDKP